MIGELRGRGHEVLVISPAGITSLPCPTYPEIRLALMSAGAIGRRIVGFGAQAVHIATEGPLGLAARRWCAGRGIAFTTAYHTQFPDYVAERTGANPEWIWRYVRWFHAASAAVLVSTPTVATALAAHGITHTRRWGRGVAPVFSPTGPLDARMEAARTAGGGPILLHVGRVAPEKNIEAFLACDTPGTKVVVGNGPELKRLRISSIDSIEADSDLLDAIAGDPRLMPHLHLSLQSGDDMILKRMKRRHLRADAIAFCDQVRRLRPDVVFGGDIIAGFPTETDEMFARSLDLLDECGLTQLHVFPFSPRPGTPAARMPQVPGDVIKGRARRLREKGEAALCRHLDREVGARRNVLTERGGIARTPQFTPVRMATPIEPGLILDIAIAGHDGRQLLAA